MPQITLKGENREIIDYGTTYTDKGYKATFLHKNVNNLVSIKGTVNTKKIKTYNIIYTVDIGFLKQSIVRKVTVKDISAPKIKVNNKPIYVCPGKENKQVKVVAIDNHDGDISKNVKVKQTKNKIVYTDKDKAGNVTIKKKKIKYEDIKKPTLKLNGSKVITTFLNEEYKDAGASVGDNCDKDLKIKTSNKVDSKKLGEYKVTYSATDKAGNTSTISRTVRVVEHDKIGNVYLTFDDGPRAGTTDVILDILKEEGIKATFFVTNNGPDELIKRIYDEGHTLALHTASHNYAIVYQSVDNYFNDLYSVANRVKRLTGYDSKIIRFPGGSSNTISRRYYNGIMSILTTEVINRGFHYFDWNVDARDAESATKTKEQVYNNVVDKLSKDKVNVVLMHDIKSYTRDALQDN